MNLEEVPRSLIDLTVNFPLEKRKNMLKMALLAIGAASNDYSDLIENFSKGTDFSEEQLYAVLGTYIGLIKLFLANNSTDFENKLIDIGFPTEFIKTLPLIDHREDIISNIRNNYDKDFHRVSTLKWRIDISLGNSLLSKKIPSSVILTLNLNNGNRYTLEIDAKMFHRLRFNVALLLKELTLLRTNSISKQ